MSKRELATILYYDPIFLEHDTGDHPEQPERLEAILRALRSAYGSVELRRPPEVDRALLESVHDPAYIRRLEAVTARGGGQLDLDTVVSKQSFAAALRAAGAACAVVDAVMRGPAPASAFALVRPPGHHALPEHQMGFCLFGNVALAARHAQVVHGIKRVLIIDWDVHHGNGTQAIFYDDPNVSYFSTHQYPFYPGTGTALETGLGAGAGTTCNVPLPPRIGDGGYLAAFEQVLVPFAHMMQPELILVSAGYDAHHADVLAYMAMTDAGFGALTRVVMDLAATLCPGKLAFVLEGGYNLNALGSSVVATLDALNGAPQEQPLRPPETPALRVIEQVRSIHGLW